MVDIWLVFGRYLVNFVVVDIYYNPTGRPDFVNFEAVLHTMNIEGLDGGRELHSRS